MTNPMKQGLTPDELSRQSKQVASRQELKAYFGTIRNLTLQGATKAQIQRHLLEHFGRRFTRAQIGIVTRIFEMRRDGNGVMLNCIKSARRCYRRR